MSFFSARFLTTIFDNLKNNIASTMTKKVWILGAVVATAAVTVAIMLTACKQKTKREKKLAVISDAGYEIAHDVHFPLRHNKPGKRVKS